MPGGGRHLIAQNNKSCYNNTMGDIERLNEGTYKPAPAFEKVFDSSGYHFTLRESYQFVTPEQFPDAPFELQDYWQSVQKQGKAIAVQAGAHQSPSANFGTEGGFVLMLFPPQILGEKANPVNDLSIRPFRFKEGDYLLPQGVQSIDDRLKIFVESDRVHINMPVDFREGCFDAYTKWVDRSGRINSFEITLPFQSPEQAKAFIGWLGTDASAKLRSIFCTLDPDIREWTEAWQIRNERLADAVIVREGTPAQQNLPQAKGIRNRLLGWLKK